MVLCLRGPSKDRLSFRLTFFVVEANVSTSIREVDSTARGSAAAWVILPVCKYRCHCPIPHLSPAAVDDSYFLKDTQLYDKWVGEQYFNGFS